ncbi:uncharacterized protein LOC128955912 [Oppia nitens]|uniref:uncharacterized protein LOC128955912 n=1 Tax=Oppia nitens TaxID=1686743 RepID=UPI0023D9BC2A|nr:uncharacterized protein LOC128955912 [Oppia nitens]
MNSLREKRVISLLIILILFFDLCLCETTRKPKRRRPNRPKSRKKTDEPPRIRCYTCYVDFRSTRFTDKNHCYNPYLNTSLTDTFQLTQCSQYAKYCTVDIMRINSVIAVIDRRCGVSTCRNICINKGYGVEFETCSYCCPGKLTEEDDDYDPDESDNYRCPNIEH